MTDPDPWESMQEDVALRLMEGDETVLVDILKQYAPALEKCLFSKYRAVLNLEDIEDIVAVAVRELWDYRFKYDDKVAKVWTLLYLFADREAQNVISLGWQQARRREKTNVPDEWLMRRLDAASSNEAVPPKPETKMQRDVRDSLAALPEVQGKILVAKAMAPDGEVTAGMLAEELGIPSSTVRVYLMRAKEAFKREMARRGHQIS